jgi:S1-C subfamily serine protease/pSer/pThr/pTyr-binding forkhead associated (FHA) protein
MQLTITAGADAGKTVQVQGNEFTIGREAGADLVLADGKASRRHAALRVLPDGRATLYDLGSSNGTFVNGQRVQSMLLQGGEQIQIGDTVLVPGQVIMPGAQPAGGAQGVTSAGAAVPVTAAAAAPPPQAPPQQAAYTPPTQPLPTQQPVTGFQAPSPTPIQRPSRTQSAIQRVMLQRAVNRATIIGLVAIVLVVGVGIAAALGVFSGDGAKSASNAEIVEKVKPSTYFIVTNKGDAAGRGTGWVWDAANGIIVTNAHVVAGGEKWSVASGDDLKIEVNRTDTGADIVASPGGRDAKLLGQANCEDIGVLQVADKAGLETLPRGSSSALRLGDKVVAVGYPSTLNTAESDTFSTPGFTRAQLTATSGDVATVSTTFGAIPGEGPDDATVGPYEDVILTDTVINKGNSGGPLVNEDAELVGMNSAGRTDVQGQNYAVSVDRIKEMVPQIIAGKDVCAGRGG